MREAPSRVTDKKGDLCLSAPPSALRALVMPTFTGDDAEWKDWPEDQRIKGRAS